MVFRDVSLSVKCDVEFETDIVLFVVGIEHVCSEVENDIVELTCLFVMRLTEFLSQNLNQIFKTSFFHS